MFGTTMSEKPNTSAAVPLTSAASGGAVRTPCPMALAAPLPPTRCTYCMRICGAGSVQPPRMTPTVSRNERLEPAITSAGRSS